MFRRGPSHKTAELQPVPNKVPIKWRSVSYKVCSVMIPAQLLKHRFEGDPLQ